MRRRIHLFILVLFTTILVITAAQAAPSVSIIPASQNLKQDDTFVIGVYFDPAGASVSAGEIDISFDASALQVTSLVKGDILGSDAFTTGSQYNNTLGTVNAVLARFGDTPDPSPAGYWANVTFKINSNAANKNYYINLTSIGIADKDFNDILGTIPNNGTITIGSILKSILISPSATTTLTVGESQLFSATAIDQNDNPITGIEVSWTVSNSTVGSVNPTNGITVTGGATTMFTALAAGTTMVNATNASVKGTASVTINPLPPVLTSIVVSPSSATLTAGATQAFIATAFNGTNRMPGVNISWTSSNTTVGTVSQLFVITGADGNASVTFISDGAGTSFVNATNSLVKGTASVTVNPVPPVLTSIVVSPSSVTLTAGATQAFIATAFNGTNRMPGVNISWTSSNTTVGTVNQLFAITGADGNASVTFSSSVAGNSFVNATNASVKGTASVTVNPVPPVLTSIVVSPSSAILTAGATQAFIATAFNGTNRMSGVNISWTSSNTTVGTVNQLFAITGADGNASVTFSSSVAGNSFVNATNASVKGTASVTVNPVSPVLTSIVVSPSSAILTAGATQAFIATAFNGTNRMSGVNISWTSSNTTVGTVNQLFAITGADGNASVTFSSSVAGNSFVNATNASVKGTASATVNPVPPVLTSIVVSPSSATLTAGAGQTFIATAFNGTNRMSGVNISWTSSNTTVGTVNQLFAITGADGNASVTFSSSVAGNSFVNATNASVKGTASVTVNPVPPVLTSIVVSPSSATLTAGATQAFIATAFNGTNRMPGVNISWTSSNTTVGTVNQLFAITGADGNASVTFSSSVAGNSFVNATNASVKGTASVTVNPVPPVLTSIVVSPSSATLTAGATQAFIATAFNGTNRMPGVNISWTSSNTTVGTVNQLFAITGADGNASVTFSSSVAGNSFVNATNSSVKGTASVTVNPVPPVLTSIVVSPSSATLTAGATQAFTATAFNGTNRMPGVIISWTSSNTTVGTVNQLFAITGADGNASVTFSSSVAGNSFVNATNSSVKGTASVTVNPVPPVLTSIVVSPSSATLTAGATQAFIATAFNGTNRMPGVNISWTSSNTTVGTVNQLFANTGSDGNASVTFSSSVAGNSFVNATNASVKGTASVTVNPTVNPVPPVLTSIVVSPSSATLTAGASQAFIATAFNGTNRMPGVNISWTSSNTTVGTVNQLFANTGSDGNASVTFSSSVAGNSFVNATNSSVKGTASVTVNPVPPVLTSIVVSPSSATLTAGATQAFIATAFNGTNRMPGVNISWTSSNTTVGTVNQLFANTGSDGNASVTFSSSVAGNSFVNATNASVKGTASVTVNPTVNPVPPVLTSIVVSPSSATLTAGASQAFIATAFNGTNRMPGVNISWTSSNTTVGTVNQLFANTGSDGNASVTFSSSVAGNSFVNATNGSFKGTAIVTVSNTPPVVQNLIINPGFELGTASWNFYTNGIGTFTTENSGYAGLSGKIVINDPNTNTQLYQVGITVEPNTLYRLRFAARSTMGNDISIELLKHVSPYTNYGLNKQFDLTSSWQEFSTEFTSSGFSNTVNDGRLKFWLAPFAAAGEIYYIDDVRLEKVSPSGIPTIITHPASQTVNVGMTATFNVSAIGTTPLRYQWQKNGTNIPGATNPSYTTPATSLYDNGSTFRVNVTNIAGSVMSIPAFLTVISIRVVPSIITQPLNQTVNVGQTATFSVSATGTAPLSYQWQKNGTNIPGATNPSYTTPTTSLTDNGSTFRVNVTNIAGSVMSNYAALTVLPGSNNLIKNSDFELGISPWIYYTNGMGKFTTENSGYVGLSAKIAVNDPGTNTQLYQAKITVEPNTRYRLRFAARSTMGNDISVEFLKHVSPFTNYGLNKEFDLTSSWQEFSTEFTTSGFTNIVNDGRLKFWLADFAQAGEVYYIDNVSLEKI